MALEQAIMRLTLRSSKPTICHHCRQTRALSTTTPLLANGQTSATSASFADMLNPKQPRGPQQQQSTPQQPRRAPYPASTAAPPSPGSPAARQSQSTSPNNFYTLAESTIRTASTQKTRENQLAELARTTSRRDLETQLPRRGNWFLGDVYAPHDLSGVEAAKHKKTTRRGNMRGRGQWDVVDVLGLKPEQMYRNFSVMSEYVTEMGRLRHRNETGLRPVNQRRMARAVRRAVGIGLMPSVHRHPEILMKERQRLMQAQRGR